MTATDLYHVGVLVHDLEAGIQHFGASLGLTFETPRLYSVLVEHRGESTPRQLRVAYSIEGPPFVELLESQSEGPWHGGHGEGLHHMGFHEDDLAGRLAALKAAGTPADTTIFIGPDPAAAYLHPDHLHGTRIELVARSGSEYSSRD